MNSIITNPPSILTPTQQSNIATYGNPTGIKSYVALLTQTGTDAPVATVLENTLGGTVVWSRPGAGTYPATLVGAFTADKTFILFSLGQLGDFGGTEPVYARRISADEVQIISAAGADFATDAPIFFQIIVYP